MYESSNSEAPGLEEYLRALRSRWWVVVVAVVVGLLAASLFTSSRTPMYQAAAKVTLGPSPVGGSLAQPAFPDPATEADRLKSTAVATAVAQKITPGTDAEALLRELEVSYLQQRNVLDLTFTDPSAPAAQAIVNGFATEYTAMRESAARAFYENEITRINREIESKTTLINETNVELGQVANILSNLYATPVANRGPDYNQQVNELESRRGSLDSLRNQYNFDRTRAQDQLFEATRGADNRAPAAEVTRAASLPEAPIGVSDTLVRLAGVLLGLIAGVVLAFTLARLDRSASDTTEVEEATGAPVLAGVPQFRMARTTGINALVMVTNSRSLRIQRARESYRRLRTSLQMQLGRTGRNSLLVTSAYPSEGKSVTATNLAIANAQAGKRTVLVSADLRRPSVERLLSVPNDKGLSDWLAEETEAVVQELPSIPNLSVIVAGNQLDGPGELLASPRLAALIDDLEAEYDLVVLDTPPVLATADAATVASSVGGVLVVVDGRRSDLRVLQTITSELSRAGGRLVGTVLNRTKSQPGQSLLRRDAYAYEREARKRLG